jgi:hypothetical protein
VSLSYRPRKCKWCKESFSPERVGQKTHKHCEEPFALKVAEKLGETRRKERLRVLDETIPKLIKVADRAFAAFIRERDRQAGHPCISSGRPLDWSGNQVDAGHYRSRGAASHLRYDEDNCHAQSKHDNQFKAGNVVDYRINLIGRIGPERLEALETNNTVHKWTKDELRERAAIYRQKLKELKGNE